MYYFFATLHVLVSGILILVVLLQSGKGGMGAAFGGASQTVFGARGAGSLLGKLTAICAAIFMSTSLSLAWLSTSRDQSLREAAEQQEARAKARAVKAVKRAKAPEPGKMSGEEEEGVPQDGPAPPGAQDEPPDEPPPPDAG